MEKKQVLGFRQPNADPQSNTCKQSVCNNTGYKLLVQNNQLDVGRNKQTVTIVVRS